MSESFSFYPQRITFHKRMFTFITAELYTNLSLAYKAHGHSGSTLSPTLVKEFAQRLKNSYGWSRELFCSQES